jgi:hypothetical protein
MFKFLITKLQLDEILSKRAHEISIVHWSGTGDITRLICSATREDCMIWYGTFIVIEAQSGHWTVLVTQHMERVIVRYTHVTSSSYFTMLD